MSIFDLAGPIFDLSWRQNFIKYGYIKLVPYFHPMTVRSAQKRSLLFNSSHFDQFFPQIVHFGHFDHIWSPFGPWGDSWGTPGSPMSGWIPFSTHPTATKFQPVQYLTYTLFWGTLIGHRPLRAAAQKTGYRTGYRPTDGRTTPHIEMGVLI